MSKKPQKFADGWHLVDENGVRCKVSECDDCIYYRGEDPCDMSHHNDELSHCFCGSVCGRYVE